jgi:hypothetical protein
MFTLSVGGYVQPWCASSFTIASSANFNSACPSDGTLSLADFNGRFDDLVIYFWGSRLRAT